MFSVYLQGWLGRPGWRGSWPWGQGTPGGQQPRPGQTQPPGSRGRRRRRLGRGRRQICRTEGRGYQARTQPWLQRQGHLSWRPGLVWWWLCLLSPSLVSGGARPAPRPPLCWRPGPRSWRPPRRVQWRLWRFLCFWMLDLLLWEGGRTVGCPPLSWGGGLWGRGRSVREHCGMKLRLLPDPRNFGRRAEKVPVQKHKPKLWGSAIRMESF